MTIVQRTCAGPVSAECLIDGSWTSRWADWVIHLRAKTAGWRVIVWRWTTGGGLAERMQLGHCEGFPNAADAQAWACDLLREGGAEVFIIDRPQLRLEDFLRYQPVPEDVT